VVVTVRGGEGRVSEVVDVLGGGGISGRVENLLPGSCTESTQPALRGLSGSRSNARLS